METLVLGLFLGWMLCIQKWDYQPKYLNNKWIILRFISNKILFCLVILLMNKFFFLRLFFCSIQMHLSDVSLCWKYQVFNVIWYSYIFMYEKGDRNSLEITHTRIFCVVSLFEMSICLKPSCTIFLSINERLLCFYCVI